MRAYANKSARRAALAALGLAIMGAVAPAAAQDSANRVEAHRDWSVFVADAGGPVCWVVTQPKSSVARRGGNPVQVRRGDIYLTVAIRPEQGVENEVAVVSGYPYKQGSEVEVEIGGDTFELFTQGENAWPYPEDDGELIAAMKGGVAAVVTGVSSRGTTTEDRFSLLGFTDALNAAQARCE
ncbi:MAG: invasion associated locus B family protein [Pseudomonadota bacterium]